MNSRYIRETIDTGACSGTIECDDPRVADALRKIHQATERQVTAGEPRRACSGDEGAVFAGRSLA